MLVMMSFFLLSGSINAVMMMDLCHVRRRVSLKTLHAHENDGALWVRIRIGVFVADVSF